MNQQLLKQPLLKASLAFGTAALLLTGCESTTDKQPGWNEQTQIYNTPRADAEMLAAQRKSRATIGKFITALVSRDTANHNFAVKYGFVDGSEREYMWIGNLTVHGDSLHGTLDNQPEYIHNVQDGQPVAIHKDSIADWNYTRKGRLQGGYSIRLIRSRMTPAEREEFDKSVGWKLE